MHAHVCYAHTHIRKWAIFILKQTIFKHFSHIRLLWWTGFYYGSYTGMHNLITVPRILSLDYITANS